MYSKPSDKLKYGGKVYRLTLSFDRVLCAIEAFRRGDLMEEHALDLSISLLVRGKVRPQAKAGLLSAIFKSIEDKKPESRKKTRCVDFVQDEKYIYASFMQAYGIDLYRTKPHWTEFVQLFEGLPSDTVIKQIMAIRDQDIPKATKDNGKHIRDLLEAKARYRLDIPEEERKETFKSGLKDLAQFLFSQSGR